MLEGSCDVFCTIGPEPPKARADAAAVALKAFESRCSRGRLGDRCPIARDSPPIDSMPSSVLAELVEALPQLRPQIYFKSSLTALSHAMEDRVLAGSEQPLVIASFQRERYYRQEAHRYQRIARKSDHVYVLSAAETEFCNSSQTYETVAFAPDDALAREWHLVVMGQQYATCLICRERARPESRSDLDIEPSRRFEGIWTFDPSVGQTAARILLDRIVVHRPELADKAERARKAYLQLPGQGSSGGDGAGRPVANPDPFVERLVTYLQAGQYKLLKAYRSLTAKEKKERLVHSMTAVIRRSLDPDEILEIAVQRLGEALKASRCIVYRCSESDAAATIDSEFLGTQVSALRGVQWPLRDNPLAQAAMAQQASIYVESATRDARLTEGPLGDPWNESLLSLAQRHSIDAWLLVPVLYSGRLKGMLELHRGRADRAGWNQQDIELVEAVATQVGTALVQAESYTQLEALDRARSNLVAITGHELRTPLSTVQVCLESLASEPDMGEELRQTMLQTALADAERMRKLVRDFLTLSQLESGRVEWNPEAVSVAECAQLACGNIGANSAEGNELPPIEQAISPDLPFVRADGEWLVEVLAKLLDNACKFTPADGQVTLEARQQDSERVEVAIADTGRGIEPEQLERIFDWFYQEEGALQRTTGGTGLGLAICRQAVKSWNGTIWAQSAGKDCGTRFCFTVPIAGSQAERAVAQRQANPSARERASRQHRLQR